jgi:hypothetical protein
MMYLLAAGIGWRAAPQRSVVSSNIVAGKLFSKQSFAEDK